MHTRILSLFCSALLVPAGAWAQAESSAKRLRKAPPAASAPDSNAEDSSSDNANSGNETEGTEVAEPPTRPSKGNVNTGGRDAAPGEVHKVVKGDTLWDLSSQYLGNAWYWPKVWSYNPEIANPHWIYPGNNVRFFPAGEEVPSRVEAGTAPEGDESPDAVEPDVEEGKVLVSGKIGYTPPTSVRVARTGFVTSKEIDEAGTIDSSFAESYMLSSWDKVYIQFKRRPDVHLGDKYIVFHTESEVIHPVTGARYGYLTLVLGTVKIVAVGTGLVTGQIVDSWDPIVPADLVGPYGEKISVSVNQKPNDRELKGFVIGSLNPSLTLLGEHHTVVIDKGSADGVVEGNTFTVVRQGNLHGDFRNPARNQDPRLPVEDIATCLATDVKEKATVCLLTRTLREVVWGDKVEMRSARSGGASVSRR